MTSCQHFPIDIALLPHQLFRKLNTYHANIILVAYLPAYSDKRAAERINTDLANTLGNLLGRCTAPAVNKQQELPPLIPDDLYEFFNSDDREMYTRLHQLPGKTHVIHFFQLY